jgi:CHAT domain-containing protein
MLGRPATVLVTDDAGVAAYKARVAKPGADEFDFRGVAWLGKQLDISTAVSASSFRDVRQIAPSAAPKAYLGLGHNAPVSKVQQVSATRAMSRPGAVDCDWPLDNWNNPIPPGELYTADKDTGGSGTVITDAAFSDTALMQRTDLSQYRILHFATHGVVTARAAKCAAQPALLTSFGGGNSDGLLTFKEIFDLHLDADLVILSACDTAGKASAAATQQAGLGTGGDVALDGLVRAFVGAGARLVVASHWPVPDDFDATQRLITGLFSAPPGTPTVTALRMSQRQLMDDVNTSHPFYWSAFAAVGDGEMPVIRAPKANIAQASAK